MNAPISEQVRFWNGWNARYREVSQGAVSLRQASVIEGWLRELGRRDLDILDAGCGAGWMAEKLAPFGRVTAIDLADEVLARARQRAPHIRFIEGDFLRMPLAQASTDVVVSLEVLAHVYDQAAYVEKIAGVLRPGGWLMLATQNPRALTRVSGIPPPEAGQIRQWRSAREIRRLLRPRFVMRRLTSVVLQEGHGILRVAASYKVNRLADLTLGQARFDRFKEWMLLGHTLMVSARRRSD